MAFISISIIKIVYLYVILSISIPIISAGDNVHLNQIQVLHAHNSYHLAPNPELLEFFNGVIISAYLGETLSTLIKETLIKYETSFPPIPDLLSKYSVRSFEFDCYYDPKGGLFTQPVAPKIATYEDEPYPQSMHEPGWKVLHLPDIDYQTTCHTLRECLTQIKEWSVLNIGHLPIFIHIEPKTDDAGTFLDEEYIKTINDLLAQDPEGPQAFTNALEIDIDALSSLIAEILEIFNPEDIIYPESLIIDNSLKSSILNNGWPLLSELRNKVIFIMSKAYSNDILELYPGLIGSPVFTSSYTVEDSDDSVVFILPGSEDPLLTGNETEWPSQIDKNAEEVKKAVELGYMVKAFSDYHTVEARVNYEYRQNMVLKAGAHMISTDYPSDWTSNIFDSVYSVNLDKRNSPAICNVIMTDEIDCNDIDDITDYDLDFEKSDGSLISDELDEIYNDLFY